MVSEENAAESAEKSSKKQGSHTFLCVLVLGLFIFSFSAFLVVLSAESTFLNSEQIFSALEESGMVDQIYYGQSNVFSGVPPEFLNAFRNSVSKEEFGAFLKTTIKDFMDYFTSAREDIPKLTIPAFGSLTNPITYDLTVMTGKENFEMIREGVSLLMLIKYALLAISAVLLLLLVLLGRPLKRLMKFLFQAFLIPGIIVVVFSFVISALPAMITGMMAGGIPTEALGFAETFIGPFISAFSANMLLMGMLSIILGIIFLILFIVFSYLKK